MKEQMPENLPKREQESIAEDVKFVSDSMEGVSKALSRYAIVPRPTAISPEEIIQATDEEIAEILSEFEVVDPYFDKLDFNSDEGKKDGATLAAAKAEAFKEKYQEEEAKTRIEEFTNRVLAKTGKLLASKGGKTALTGATIGILGVVMTSCGRPGEAVGAGSVQPPETDATQPRTTEVTQMPTKTPTEIPATPTSTQEATATPEVEEREVGIVPVTLYEVPAEMLQRLEEESIRRLQVVGSDEVLPYGLIEDWTENFGEVENIQVSGVVRGFFNFEHDPSAGGVLVLEIPYESGDSQYIAVTVPNVEYTVMDGIYLIPSNNEIPQDDEFFGFKYLQRVGMPFSQLLETVRDESLVGQQIVIGFTSYVEPQGMRAEKEEERNQSMEMFIEALSNEQVVNNIEGGRFSPVTITIPEDISPVR